MLKFLEIRQQNDITVGTIIRNEVYLGKENLRLAGEQNIKALVKLNLSVTQGFKKDKDIFYYKKDLDIFYCRTSYVAIRKACHDKKMWAKSN